MNQYVLTHRQFERLHRITLRHRGLDETLITKILERCWPCTDEEALRVARERGVACTPEDVVRVSEQREGPLAKLPDGTFLWYPSDVDELVEEVARQGRFETACLGRMAKKMTSAEALTRFAEYLAEQKAAQLD